MSRRIVETDTWQDAWFYGLSPITKLCYLYIRDNCDNAGIWDANYTLAEAAIGFHRMNPPLLVNWEDVFTELNTPPRCPDSLKIKTPDDKKDKVGIQVMIVEGNKWWLVKFIVFQYGYKLMDDPNPNSRAGNYHKPVFKSLRKHKLLETFLALYPNVEIVNGVNNYKEFEPPTFEKVKALRDAKFKDLPEENLKLFYSTWNPVGWKINNQPPVGGWEALFQKWYDKFKLDESKTKVPERKETITEKKERIRLLQKDVAEWQKKTERKGLIDVLTPDAKKKIAELQQQITDIETEIKTGGKNATTTSNSDSKNP